MKRANVYALLVITAIFLLFCFASVIANAQEAGNDESSVTHLGERIDALFARVDTLDERVTGIEDADQQDELWETITNLDRLVGDLERDLLSFRNMSDRLAELEAVWDGPGPAYLGNGHCVLATSGAGGPPSRCSARPLSATWPGSTPCLPNTACMPSRAIPKPEKS